MHVKTFSIVHEDTTLYADLRVELIDGELVNRVRITRRKRRGGEKMLGFAKLNKAAELVLRPEGLTETEADSIEREIKEALS